MHILEFDGLSREELANAHIRVFTAFLEDDSLGIGLGMLRRFHIRAALHLAPLHPNRRHLKIWMLQFESIQEMMRKMGHDDTLPEEVLFIVALS